MNNNLRSICLSLALIFLPMYLGVSYPAIAGEPEPSVPPGTGTMKSLQEIYDKLDSVQSEVLGACAGQCDTDAFVPKTGQEDAIWSGDDGHLEKGVAWPDPRFTNNGNGTTTDNLTGLIWLRNNWCHHAVRWTEAIDIANGLEDGECGLTDGSSAGDWRLPNIRELLSLVDYSKVQPALPLNWQSYFTYGPGYYWSSTTWANRIQSSWVLDGIFGRALSNDKDNDCYDGNPTEGVTCWGDMAVWAVRDPQQP